MGSILLHGLALIFAFAYIGLMGYIVIGEINRILAERRRKALLAEDDE